MSLLLDTQALILWLAGSPKVGKPFRRAAEQTPGEIIVSHAAIWEIAIKFSIGKLPVDPETVLREVERQTFRILTISAGHIVETARLPPLHTDPFDRLLVAQARVERLTLVADDARIAAYGVATMPI